MFPRSYSSSTSSWDGCEWIHSTPHLIYTQFFVINPGNFHMNVKSIEKRAGDPFLVFGNDSRSTCTRFLCIQKISAGQGYTQMDISFVFN